jgi:hypothetical protein
VHHHWVQIGLLEMLLVLLAGDLSSNHVLESFHLCMSTEKV